MTEDRLTPLQIQAFARHLRLEEKSEATMEKYLRDIRAFARWLDGREISKGLSAAWKAHLVERGYAPASINAKLSALNSLLEFLGLGGCRVKFLRVQRRLFRDAGRELTKAEYQRLLDTAHRLGQEPAGPAGGSHGGHGHPGQRGAVSHGGGRPAGQGRDLPQGQDPHHPIAGKALPEAAPIRPKTKNRLRCNLSHQKRKRAGPPADLGGDEAAVRARRGGPGARCSPTICGTCLLWCSTGPAGTSSSWRTCWATAASRPPASTW